MKYLVLLFLVIGVLACSQQNDTKSKKADMYEASELSTMMRAMVKFSKGAKITLAEGGTIETVPPEFYNLAKQHATNDEHLDSDFQRIAPIYTNALRGIERKDSQQYYYDASIKACKSCHGIFCGGPLAVINKL